MYILNSLLLQDMFLGAIAVLDRLVANPEQAVHISQMTVSIKQMEAVAQILLRRIDTESKYLARLEGKPLHVHKQSHCMCTPFYISNAIATPCIS